ncbi:MAG TPA: methionine--tRNA ligase subunit beta, partial [Myxococcaceae bacterium]|nr:methionine--tRNA ligase subunit beta [Myxococcaceae bacterium]
VRQAFERLEYRVAIKVITEISQTANGFLQTQAPWNKIKTDPEAARRDLSDAAEVAYLVAGLLAPVVPRLSEKLFAQIDAPALTYQALEKAKYPLLDRGRPIGTPAPLIGRMEETQVSTLVQPGDAAAAAPKEAKEAKSKEPKPAKAPEAAAPPSVGATQASPGAGAGAAPGGEIDYADFAKVVLKVGKILSAERVPKADKLLKLSVDLGEGSPRTIVSGIAEAYAPEQLTGRNVVVVANLKPRALRGIESRGMLLTAGPGGKELSLLDPGPMPPGSEVK